MLDKKDILRKIKQDPQALIFAEGVRLEIERESPCPPSSKPDLIFRLYANNRSVCMVAEIVSNASRAVFLNKIDQIKKHAEMCHALPLLIAPYLSRAERALCHDHQIFFIDLSGNQWISTKGILIEREGFKNKFPEARGRRSPFSDKASLIIRELMVNYGKRRGVRELADILDLSPGFVSKIAIELEERGYIQKSQGGLRLINPEDLIADWVNHYSIKSNRQHRYFLAAISTDEVLKKMKQHDLPKSKYGITAQAGANLVHKYAAYDVVHVYVRDDMIRDYFVKSLELQPVDRGENIILMEPKYRKSAFFQSREIKGLSVVSDLQLYLDLYHYPKRGREQAEKIYDLKLAPLFEE